MNDEDLSFMPHYAPHPWKARFIVGTCIIALAFIGLVLSSLWQDGAWMYWRVASPICAILCLGLSWYVRKKQHSFSVTALWKELFLWIALIFGIFLLSLFVKVGIMGRFEAGLAILTMLALIVFIGGVYIDPSLIFVGIILGLFSVGAAYLEAYLYSILLPIAFVGIGVLLLFAYYKKTVKHKHYFHD